MDSLQKQFPKEFAEGLFELIIVDNDSGDDSVKQLNERIKTKSYKHTTVIANPENAGFGKGCNLGARHSKGDFILFLNNDTVAKDRGILSMAHYMKAHSEIGILGGQLRNPDGSLQASTGKFYTLYNAFLLLLGMQKYGLLDKSPQQITEVDWVKGGLLMMSREAFITSRGFDEKIFMYTEDMELCYRVKKAGYKIVFYPDLVVLHAEHGSTNKTFAIIHIYKGLPYFYKKHRSNAEYVVLRALLKVKAGFLFTAGKLLGNDYLIQTYGQAFKVA